MYNTLASPSPRGRSAMVLAPEAHLSWTKTNGIGQLPDARPPVISTPPPKPLPDRFEDLTYEQQQGLLLRLWCEDFGRLRPARLSAALFDFRAEPLWAYLFVTAGKRDLFRLRGLASRARRIGLAVQLPMAKCGSAVGIGLRSQAPISNEQRALLVRAMKAIGLTIVELPARSGRGQIVGDG